MFGANIQLPRHGILTYDQAVAKHDSIAPIRGRAVDTRPLGNRRNDSLTIRRCPKTDAIAIRLYQTDIITYNTDGTIDLEPYASKLTDEAVTSVFRGKVRTNYTSPVGPVLWTHGRGYHIPEFATLDKDFNLIAGAKPFTRYSVDRKAANAACKKGFNQFKLWVQTQVRLGIDPRSGDGWGLRYTYDLGGSVVRSLDEPDRYADIARGMSKYVTIDSHLDAIRSAVLKYHDCIVESEVPYVIGWNELTSIQASKRRWG